MIVAILAALAIAASEEAAGPAAAPAAQPVAQPAAAAKPKRVCHTEEVTGSHNARRVCVTVGEQAAGEVSPTIMKSAPGNINTGARQ